MMFRFAAARVPACALCSALLWPAVPAHAEDPIDTDGPDFVESSEVVPAGRFQFELDVARELESRNGGLPANAATPLLLRYGFREDFELRVATDGLQREPGLRGTGDLTLGLKWHAQDRDPAKGVPAVSWILHFDLPTGSKALRGQGVRPSLRSVITWDLPNDMSFGALPGFRADHDSTGQRYIAATFGGVLGKKLSETNRVFAELSISQLARADRGGNIINWDVGGAQGQHPRRHLHGQRGDGGGLGPDRSDRRSAAVS